MRLIILHVFQFLSILSGLWILSAPLLLAVEPAFVRESIRARGMGNAFTAAANDEMLFFYNPAGLRSVKYNIYEVTGFNFTTNQNTLDMGNSSSSASTLGEIAGQKIYIEPNIGLLSHVNSRFGWSFFSGALLDFQVRNPVFPYLETKAYIQTGIAGGMAWSFMDYQLDFGLGAKIVQRAGIDTKQHVFDAAIVEITEDKIAILSFGGGCQGCAQVDMTLKYGVEEQLVKAVPELKGIRDITDHSDTSNAFY